MATSRFKGDAYFEYVRPVTPFDIVQHTIRIPLWECQPADELSRYDWWAEDKKNREIVLVGDGVEEMYSTIRFDDEPVALRQMLVYGLRYNTTLTYYQAGIAYPTKLVEVVGASSKDQTPLQPDRDRLGYGEWECRLRLRRVDGGTLDGILTIHNNP